MWAATAIAVSAGVGLISSSQAASAAKKAAKGQNYLATIQGDIAKEQWDKYKSLYQPLEEQYVSDAQNYSSPEQFARSAGEASATVSSQFAKARDRLNRTPGLDTSNPAYTQGLFGLTLGQAATDATQQNAARQSVRDTAYARQTNALNLGKGLPGTAMNGLSSAATQLGNVANSQQTLANNQAANAGTFTNQIYNAAKTNGWLGSSFTPNTEGMGGPARQFDFSENMQQYGI